METIDTELTLDELIWLNKILSNIYLADIEMSDIFTAKSASKKLRALEKQADTTWQVDENWKVVEGKGRD